MEKENTALSVGDRPLPEGKLYHVFVSYKDSDEDRDWVRQLISNLQNLNCFKCCDHSSDFEPGRTIVENIRHSITRSVKTIIILSKEYQNSNWCGFEAEYAFQVNMELNKKMLIPVLKEDCEFPDFLSPFTYVDARHSDTERWLPQLVSAIESEGEKFNYQLATRLNQYAGVNNLDVLHEDTSRCALVGHVFSTKYVPPSLTIDLIRVDSDLFSQIMKQITSSCLVTGRHFRSLWWPTVLSFIYFLAAYGAVVVVQTTILSGVHINPYFGFIYLAIVSAMAFIWIPTCCITEYQARRQLKKICLDSNKKLIKNNVLLTVCRNRLKADIKVMFLYYNSKQCLDRLQLALRNREEMNQDSSRNNYKDMPYKNEFEPLIVTTHSESSIKEQAVEIFVTQSYQYLQDFMAQKLEPANTGGHTTGVICICKYAMSKGAIAQIHVV